MKSQTDKSSDLIMGVVLLLGLLGLISGRTSAATIDFDDPMTITNGYTVIDYNKTNKTQLQIDFTGAKGVSLLMNHSRTADEFFAFKLNNLTGASVDKVSFGFSKPVGVALNNNSGFDEWGFAIADKWDVLKIDWDNLNIVESNNAVAVEIPFLDSGKWVAGQSIYLFKNWDSFNHSATDWLLTIDLNANDLNAALATPIPAAIWVFGTGLAGLLTVSGRSKT